MLREAANLLEGRRVIGRIGDEISKNPRPTEEEMEALHTALYDYAAELTRKYAPLYDIFLESEDPENDPRLSEVVEVDYWIDDKPYFSPPILGKKVFNGIEIEIDSTGAGGPYSVESEVYMLYLHDAVHIGCLYEHFGSEFRDYYDVAYGPDDWDDIEERLDHVEEIYYGRDNE